MAVAAELVFTSFVLLGAAGLVFWRTLARGQFEMAEAMYRVAPLLFLWRPPRERAAQVSAIVLALAFIALGLTGLFS